MPTSYPDYLKYLKHKTKNYKPKLSEFPKILPRNITYAIMLVGSNQSSDWNTEGTTAIELDYPLLVQSVIGLECQYITGPLSHQTRIPIYNKPTQSSNLNTLGSTQSSDWNTHSLLAHARSSKVSTQHNMSTYNR
mgnify:CR=1 FL=1